MAFYVHVVTISGPVDPGTLYTRAIVPVALHSLFSRETFGMVGHYEAKEVE
jgi:hypothetical protein